MIDTEARPLALVTGASSGIGLQLARQFAKGGHDLVVVAESDLILDEAPGLRALGVDVMVIRQDLATREGVTALMTALADLGRPIDCAALNAGVGVGGPFLETSLEAELDMVDLNVGGTLALTKHLLRMMVARGAGRLLLTSSISATMPNPYLAAYGATKAFVQSLADAVRFELEDAGIHGVTITTLLPGPTDTHFFERAHMLDTKVGASEKDDPALVAEQAYRALLAGDHRVVGGSFRNKMQVAANKLVTAEMAAAQGSKPVRPGSAFDV